MRLARTRAINRPAAKRVMDGLAPPQTSSAQRVRPQSRDQARAVRSGRRRETAGGSQLARWIHGDGSGAHSSLRERRAVPGRPRCFPASGVGRWAMPVAAFRGRRAAASSACAARAWGSRAGDLRCARSRPPAPTRARRGAGAATSTPAGPAGRTVVRNSGYGRASAAREARGAGRGESRSYPYHYQIATWAREGPSHTRRAPT